MAKRIYLGLVQMPQGNLTFTLVMQCATDYYVEQYDPLQPPDERITVIHPADFGKYKINGQSLADLISAAFREALKAN